MTTPTTFTYLDAILKVEDSTGSNPFTTTLTSNSLSSTSTFDITVPSLKLNGTPSTESGQVITSNSVGQPSWETPAITLGSTNTWTGANSFTSSITANSSIVAQGAITSSTAFQCGDTINSVYIYPKSIEVFENSTNNGIYITTDESFNVKVVNGSSQSKLDNTLEPNFTALETSGKYVTITPTKLDVNDSTGTTGQVLTRLSADNTYGWQTPAITLGSTNTWTGPNTFTTPPQSVTPVLGTDVSTKGYVDSMAGQYGGGLNLFLNYSSTSSVSTDYKVLSKTVSSAALQSVTKNLSTLNQEVSIAKFMSEPLGLSVIPIGLWDMIIYGSVNNIDGNINYYYRLYKYSGTFTLIGESTISPDVNSTSLTNPNSYPVNYTITTPYSLANLTDRVYIEIFAKKTTGTASVTLTTFFEGGYYSYVGTTLNAGTTLLGSTNTWTAINSFGNISLTPSTDTLAIGSTVTGTDSSRLTPGLLKFSAINNDNLATTVDKQGINGIYSTTKKFSLEVDEPGGILTLEKSATEKVILSSIGLSVGNSATPYGTTGQVLTRLSALDNTYGWQTPAITLGSTNTWSALNTFSNIVSTATLAAGDSSTKVSTTGFVTSAITSLLAATNLWSGANSFTIPPTSVTPVLGADVSTKGYVDSMAGQYGGGLNLFLNYSSTSSVSTYKVLSKTVLTGVSQTVTNNLTTTGVDVLIAKFMSEPLGLSVIPTGIWDMIIYGSVNNTVGTLHYFYKLYTYTQAGVSSLKGESSPSPNVDVNSVTPTPMSYRTTFTITAPISIANPDTDRVYIELYAKRTGTAGSVTLTTYFEGTTTYSYIGTSLNAGTTLLSSTNTWTGPNTFSTETIFNNTTTFNTPLTINYNPSAIGTMNASNTKIGNKYTVVPGTNINTSSTANAPTSWITWNMPIGVWLVETCFFINSGAIDRVQWSVTNQASPTEDTTTRAGASTNVSSGCMARSTCVIVNTVNDSTWRINGFSSGVSTQMQGIVVAVTRIA